MPNKRRLKLDDYGITKYAYDELKAFCLQYPDKKRKIADLHNPLKCQQYSNMDMPHGSGVGMPTAQAAERAAELTRDRVECKLNECTMKHLSGEANNINGLLLSSFIVDEVANQEDASIIGALKLSQMSTKDRLSIYISTQYDLEINAFNDL
jgi:phage terminase large subunit-like protein